MVKPCSGRNHYIILLPDQQCSGCGYLSLLPDHVGCRDTAVLENDHSRWLRVPAYLEGGGWEGGGWEGGNQEVTPQKTSVLHGCIPSMKCKV